MKVEPNPATRVRALIALALVCFFWGTTWIATKEGISRMPALQMAGIRQLAGGLLYLIYFLGKGQRFPSGKEWKPVLILTLLNFVLTNGLTTIGLQYITPGLGAIIAAIFPLWIVVIGLFQRRRTPPLQALLGLVLGFIGICFVFYDHLQDFLNAEFQIGIILSLIASITWAFATIYTKSEAINFNPYFSLGLQMFFSGIIMSSLSYLGGENIPLAEIPWQSWAAIGYLTLFGSVISFLAYLYALQHLPTTQTSVYAYVNPVVAVIAGFIVYGDPLTTALLLGGAVILYGVYLINAVYRKAL